MRPLKIYMIYLEDNGSHGEKIGCDDSVIPLTKFVKVRTKQTEDAIIAALTQLLAIHSPTTEQGYYTALHQSNLTVSNVTIEQRIAHVQLTGTYLFGGVCDNPRFEAQLIHTVTQFDDIDEARITINGKSLADIISLK